MIPSGMSSIKHLHLFYQYILDALYQYMIVKGYPYGHIGGRPDVEALIEVEHRGREDACDVAENMLKNMLKMLKKM